MGEEEVVTRPGWGEWALRLAEVVATRADCTRSQVGAVLLSRDHRVLSVGYNGLPAGIPGCATAGNCPRGQLTTEQCERDSNYANCAATHAERNAIEHADPYELPGATLYVTRPPCPGCTTLITACGIVRVVHPLGEDLLPEPSGKEMPECVHPWPAQNVTSVEHSNCVQVWCEICGDVTHAEIDRIRNRAR